MALAPPALDELLVLPLAAVLLVTTRISGRLVRIGHVGERRHRLRGRVAHDCRASRWALKLTKLPKMATSEAQL